MTIENTPENIKKLRKKIGLTQTECGEIFDLKQGISASGARYTDGIYVFWSKGDEATVYKRDRIVLNNCQLQNPQR